MAEDPALARQMQRGVATALHGHPVDLALGVLIAETARVIASLDLPAPDLREVTTQAAAQLHEAVEKWHAVRMAAKAP